MVVLTLAVQTQVSVAEAFIHVYITDMRERDRGMILLEILHQIITISGKLLFTIFTLRFDAKFITAVILCITNIDQCIKLNTG